MSSAGLLNPFYQESLIQIFFLCENTLCCQWEWWSCVDDFWCREFCEVQPWALSSFRLLKLLCGKKKKTNQNPQFRYFVFPITQCPRYLISFKPLFYGFKITSAAQWGFNLYCWVPLGEESFPKIFLKPPDTAPAIPPVPVCVPNLLRFEIQLFAGSF